MKDSIERITRVLTHAAPGWPIRITYRNGPTRHGEITITAPFIGIGTDVRKLRGERRYAIVDSRDVLGLVVIPFGTILTASVHDPKATDDE